LVRSAVENIARTDALCFGRIVLEMMEARGFRARAGVDRALRPELGNVVELLEDLRTVRRVINT